MSSLPAPRPRRSGAIAVVTCAFSIATVTLDARAETAARPTARLAYTRGPGAETCPDESALRTAVAERLGYDPFVVDGHGAPRQVTIHLARGASSASASGYHASVVLDEAGSRNTRAPLASNASECTEIAAALALSVSIAVDPASLLRPSPKAAAPSAAGRAPASSPSAASAPAPAGPTTAPPTTTTTNDAAPRHDASASETDERSRIGAAREPAPARRRAIGLRAMAGIMGSAGALPAPSFGPLGSVGLRASRFAFDLGGRFDAPVTADGPSGGRITASLFLGTAAACFEPKPFVACALFAAGALSGRGHDVDVTAADTTFYAAGGGRIAFELPIRAFVASRLQIDAYAPLGDTTLRIVKADTWTTPSVFGTASLVLAAAP